MEWKKLWTSDKSQAEAAVQESAQKARKLAAEKFACETAHGRSDGNRWKSTGEFKQREK